MAVATSIVCIASITTVIGGSVGIINASFSLKFSISLGLIKNYWKQQEKT